MEVVIWQLFVIGTVAVAYAAKGRSAAFWVCVGWTLWTIAAVFMLPLALVQLLFCWGTYSVCTWIASLGTSISKKDKQIAELKRQVEEVLAGANLASEQNAVVRRALSEPRIPLEIISGAQHFEILKRAIVEAQHRLCVLSGWIGSPLLDPQVQGLLRQADSRGVKIYLGFGHESNSGHTMSATANIALSFLRSLSRNNVAIAQFPNHEKLLVVDDKYCVIGSNNWLSNAAFKNSERSLLVRIRNFSSEEANRIQSMVLQHRV